MTNFQALKIQQGLFPEKDEQFLNQYNFSINIKRC